ncbi:uncharacterized protein LOC141691977 [Apium graveolens]|uniref:uncharacterized protein LOC141691977 n=1 Tax=Apium graveolens TaxID=4045 RepID=UPI003D7AC2B8
MAEQTQTHTQDPSQDPSPVFYIHPSDNPGMKLVSMKFDGSSYGDWKRSMLISLAAKNKIGFVDGTVTKPNSTDPNYRAWDRCNNMLISWILGVLDQDISRSDLYFNIARDIWLNLEERLGQASGTLLYALQQALHDIRQGHDSISGYYTKMKMLWDQLDSVDIMPMCKCTNCTCEITAKMMKLQQDRRLVWNF